MSRLIKNNLLIPLLFALFAVTSLVTAAGGLAEESQPLEKGVFLVANPGLRGLYFRKSVVLLVSQGKDGMTGLIINRPSNHPLSEALPGIKQFEKSKAPLFVGGPLLPHIPFALLRADEAPNETIKVFDHVYFSHNISVLSAEATARGQQNSMRIYAGYAGWAPGQLEAEIAGGSWKIVRGDADIIFERKNEEIWDDLIRDRKRPPSGMMVMALEIR